MDNNDEFPRRFKQACDDSPDVPDLNDGRYVSLARKLDVSEEAVRKWFEGRSRPRVATMKALAKFLNVDEAWLSLGVEPEVTPRERRVWSRKASGAVFAVFGLIRMFGATSAFPSDDEPDHVNLEAIIDAQSVDIFCTLASDDTGGQMSQVYLPREHEKSRVILVVPGDSFNFRLFTIDNAVLRNHRINRTGFFEIEVRFDRDGWCYSGEDSWRPVKSLRDFL